MPIVPATLNAKPRLRRLFRLRTILMVAMLSILVLPLGSLYFFRFYENELVRKTELELITQSVVFSSIYLELLKQNQEQGQDSSGQQFTPIEPALDLSSHKILPRRPMAERVYEIPNTSLLAGISGTEIQNILKNTQQYTLAGIRIVDSNGVVVAGTSEVGLSLAHIDEVRQALQGKYVSVLRERISDEPPPSIASLSRGTGIRVFTAFPIMHQGQVFGVIYLSRTPQNILKHLYGIKGKVITLSLVLFGLTGIFVLFLSARLSRPIRELSEQTQKVTTGELQTVEVLRQPGTYELAQLSRNFVEMSNALNERSNYIREFASHVSHEFKTPLTSMLGALELIQEHGKEMPAEQQQRFLANIQTDAYRLERLVKRLLEQARADSLTGVKGQCELLSVLEQCKTTYAERGLQINYGSQSNDINIKIPEEELKTVLSNLFDNSLQQGADKIQIDIRNSGKRVVIDLHDNGSGISEANRKRIFTPFFTTRRESGGTGLGLGIVAAILKASNASIECKTAEQGALFEISLTRVT